MTDNDSPTVFTLTKLFIAVGLFAVLGLVIIVGTAINGNDHGPTPEQECAIQALIDCDVR
jgi:hypothetical protein